MEDYLVLEIPTFKPRYKRWKRYGYSRPEEKKNTIEALLEASGGYCMYCYSRIQIDGRIFGQLEHAIEKRNSARLIECIPDMGIACPTCNHSSKRYGESKRKLGSAHITAFHANSRCSEIKRKQCTVPCKALKTLQCAYHESEHAKIILQPMGVKGTQSGEELKIQYDVLKAEFQPALSGHSYTDEEQAFIRDHIRRFKLNDSQKGTCKLYDFVKIVIDSDGELPQYEYSNLVVELFANKLKTKTKEEILKICEMIYLAGFLTA